MGGVKRRAGYGDLGTGWPLRLSTPTKICSHRRGFVVALLKKTGAGVGRIALPLMNNTLIRQL